MLRVKYLTINSVTDVTGFPDLHINLPFLAILIVILILILIPDLEICAHLSICGHQQHVATRCRCVASRKAQRNPCKMRLVAVLRVFPTYISILRFLRFFAANQLFDGSLQNQFTSCAFVWREPLFPADAPEMLSPADLGLTVERVPALASGRVPVNK